MQRSINIVGAPFSLQQRGDGAMEQEQILSAGIDIGTSTTQLVFSRLTLQNIGGFGRIPQVKVIDKEILYKSNVYFTPLRSPEEIDGEAVSKIIKREYETAGIVPQDLATGAVIITGESSRKQNAREVVQAISEIAGDFVVATAGADLESVLAGKGAGAAELSKQTQQVVANLDIGGGTTNIGVFENGNVVDTACFDIGGRLVQIQDKRICYVAPKIRRLARELKLHIHEGGPAVIEELKILTDAMADLLAQSVGLLPSTPILRGLATNHMLSGENIIEVITFSGGVSDCFGKQQEVFQYGDIGILLAQSIEQNVAFHNATIAKAKETMRATVIGAGNYSMHVSGSTIEYTADVFPIKNLPVIRVPLEEPGQIKEVRMKLHKAMQLYKEERPEKEQVAIAIKGLKCPSFYEVQQIAEQIALQFEKECVAGEPLILIIEEDIGKAVGQALHRALKHARTIVCIDGIHCESGDFVDLGEPVASGTVIPVIVKTLIFNR